VRKCECDIDCAPGRDTTVIVHGFGALLFPANMGSFGDLAVVVYELRKPPGERTALRPDDFEVVYFDPLRDEVWMRVRPVGSEPQRLCTQGLSGC